MHPLRSIETPGDNDGGEWRGTTKGDGRKIYRRSREVGMRALMSRGRTGYLSPVGATSCFPPREKTSSRSTRMTSSYP